MQWASKPRSTTSLRSGIVKSHSSPASQQRRNAYQMYLVRYGMVVPAADICQTANHPGAAADAFTALMQSEPRATAVVASTYEQASGALHSAHRRGLRMPQDVSVVGFDDTPIAAYTVPVLTTVAVPMAVMAKTAVEVAIGRLGRAGKPEASNRLGGDAGMRPEDTGAAGP